MRELPCDYDCEASWTTAASFTTVCRPMRVERLPFQLYQLKHELNPSLQRTAQCRPCDASMDPAILAISRLTLLAEQFFLSFRLSCDQIGYCGILTLRDISLSASCETLLHVHRCVTRLLLDTSSAFNEIGVFRSLNSPASELTDDSSSRRQHVQSTKLLSALTVLHF